MNNKEYRRQKYLLEKDNILLKAKLHYKNNKDVILSKVKEYQSKSTKPKEWRENNKEYLQNKALEWHNDNRDQSLNNQKQWRENNKEYSSNWIKNNVDKVREINKRYNIKKRKEKPWIIAWRNTLTGVLKRLKQNKVGRTQDILGYDSIELRDHLEKLWVDGMNWENYGKKIGCWEIDHISPVSLFDNKTNANIVNALENLRPMWVIDNRKKGNKNI